MGNPLVSIVTPCLNSAQFLEECIKGVLAQDYPHVEHIVQDGGSTDGTVEILKRYDSKIDWVSEEDRGQAHALNKALGRSQGAILLVLNADDILLPHAAAWAVRQMTRYPEAAVAYGDVLLIDEEGNGIGGFLGPDYSFEKIFCVEEVIPAQAAFIRRSSLEQVGLGTDPELDTCPDFEMFVRLGLRFPMRHVRGFVTKYRHYQRRLDGASPRSVDRFVKSKALVMDRTFAHPSHSVSLSALRRRAHAGLYLWASEEARGSGDLDEAWDWYRRALGEFSPADRTLIKTVLTQAKPMTSLLILAPFEEPVRHLLMSLADFLARPRPKVLGLGLKPMVFRLLHQFVLLAHRLAIQLGRIYRLTAFAIISLGAGMARKIGLRGRGATEPNIKRAIFVGFGLAQDTPEAEKIAAMLQAPDSPGFMPGQRGP